MFGFCFITDDHHKPCRSYLSGNDKELYTGDWRETVFSRKKEELVGRYSDAVLDHVASLIRSDYAGRLDLLDIRNIKQSFLDPENEAHQFLWDYYDGLNEEILLPNLEEKLREVAHDMEGIALKRKEEFDEMVETWERNEEYLGIESKLSEFPNEDRGVCLDGHDLATKREGHTELATTDPKDFKYNGREDLLLSSTNIDELVILSI